MAGITLQQAQARLDQYLAAEAAVLQGQEYKIGAGEGFRSLTRADLAQIQEGVSLWNQRVQDLSARSTGRGRSVTPTPRW
jgi:hypothetical protein